MLLNCYLCGGQILQTNFYLHARKFHNVCKDLKIRNISHYKLGPPFTKVCRHEPIDIDPDVEYFNVLDNIHQWYKYVKNKFNFPLFNGNITNVKSDQSSYAYKIE
jgi:hypothetical protein